MQCVQGYFGEHRGRRSATKTETHTVVERPVRRIEHHRHHDAGVIEWSHSDE
jgi:hypothetical protein